MLRPAAATLRVTQPRFMTVKSAQMLTRFADRPVDVARELEGGRDLPNNSRTCSSLPQRTGGEA
jgi:hypothetical protein